MGTGSAIKLQKFPKSLALFPKSLALFVLFAVLLSFSLLLLVMGWVLACFVITVRLISTCP